MVSNGYTAKYGGAARIKHKGRCIKAQTGPWSVMVELQLN